MSVEFFVSRLGESQPRVLARFVTDARGLHSERLDRGEGGWVQDARIAGYLIGHDDWAERITPAEARRLLVSWGCDAGALNAPVAEAAST